jgi:hypothetical protein
MSTLNNVDLMEIQENLDQKYAEFVKKDFEMKLSHFNDIKDILKQRDEAIFVSESESEAFVSAAINNFEAMHDLFPRLSDESFDASFLKFVRAEFLEGGKMKITAELKDNSYVENKILEKTVYLSFEKDPEPTKIIWKDDKSNCPFFDFFANEDEDLEIFDVFYEFYVNMIFYSTLK